MARRRLHPESLMRLHLVRHLFADPCVRLRLRGIDARWRYARIVNSDYQGFNPLGSSVYYGHNSRLGAWIPERHGSARKHNDKDRLIRELMFAVHDYLHIWAYHWIRALVPKVGFCEKPISRRSLDDFVFCHLLSEAVATVGLDYWCLSTIDLNDLCNIGTNFSALTVSYRSRYDDEYRRFDPAFEVQTPDFYARLATFYCTGRYNGFVKHDLDHSPRLYDWLEHELSYGVAQRAYARHWYCFMAREPIELEPAGASDSVSVSAPWKRLVLRELGRLLWDKVKNDVVHSPPVTLRPNRRWRSRAGAPYDFRFQNYNQLRARDRGYLKHEYDAENFRFFLRQFLAQLDFRKVDKKLLRLTDRIESECDAELASLVFRGQARIRAGVEEPRDLFFLS